MGWDACPFSRSFLSCPRASSLPSPEPFRCPAHPGHTGRCFPGRRATWQVPSRTRRVGARPFGLPVQPGPRPAPLHRRAARARSKNRLCPPGPAIARHRANRRWQAAQAHSSAFPGACVTTRPPHEDATRWPVRVQPRRGPEPASAEARHLPRQRAAPESPRRRARAT